MSEHVQWPLTYTVLLKLFRKVYKNIHRFVKSQFNVSSIRASQTRGRSSEGGMAAGKRNLVILFFFYFPVHDHYPIQ